MRIFGLMMMAVVATAMTLGQASAVTERYYDPTSRSWQTYKITPEAAGKIVREKYKRTTVRYRTSEKPGSIIVDTDDRYLYFVLPGGKAVRYGIGVGREGFGWQGKEKITRKAKWPSWTPPQEMIVRERKKGRNLPRFMPGGPKNPMGARALYLGSTEYRIHGTNEDWSIGRAVSSGCIRMLNEDVEDLYNRVTIGARVTVL
ncbi:L,D-transpeptidase [Stappia stellulata]|uniref:L,D-transpeptidase n=1 Tax=Stappia TaxID=152161 RepID=UPI001CD275C4|nr:L,D-transpeptidase [Stappia stellulata]MCA1244128.1 L,D-transpeptidase [Stappia stellulata]